MNTTWYEKGLEKGLEQGLEKGLEKGQREALRMQLEEQFGPLAPETMERLHRISADRLPFLIKGIIRAKSLHELGLEDKS